MGNEERLGQAVKAFMEAERFAASASTREDLAGVEEGYWIAFNGLKCSKVDSHRKICAQCLEAIARILDGEGRPAAADDLRKKAAAYRRHL